jgi:protein-tyrosine phosphatase
VASILFVCTGHVCRSPIAEAAMRIKLEARFGDRAPLVSSAGTAAWDGSGAVAESVEAAGERGFELGDHVARTITREMIREADLILCMAAEHRERVLAIAGGDVADRTFTLRGLARVLEQLPPADPHAGAGHLAARVAEAARAESAAPPAAWVDEDVADPLGSPMEAFRAVAWEIDELTDVVITGLFGPRREQVHRAEEG